MTRHVTHQRTPPRTPVRRRSSIVPHVVHGVQSAWKAYQNRRKEQARAAHPPRRASIASSGGSSAVEKVKGNDLHSGVESTSYKIVVNKGRHVPMKTAPIHLYENDGTVIAVAAGKQAAGTILHACTAQQAMLSSYPNATTTGVAGVLQKENAVTAYLDMNPQRAITGSVTIPGFSGKNQPATDKLLFQHAQLNMEFVNLSNFACYFDIYIVRNKSYQYYDAVTSWQRIVGTQGNGLLNNAPPAAGVFTPSVQGAVTSDFPGAKPQNNALFRKLYKVLKVHHVNLAGAASELVNFSCDLNYLMNAQEIININVGLSVDPATWAVPSNYPQNYLKGALQMFVIARGQLVDDITGPAGGAMTPGQCKLGVGIQKKYTFRQVAGNQGRIAQDFAWSEQPTGATQANQKVISITDTVVGNSTA